MESAEVEGNIAAAGKEEDEEGGVVLVSRLDIVDVGDIVKLSGASRHVCGGWE